MPLGAGSGKVGACASPDRRKAWTLMIRWSAARLPSTRGAPHEQFGCCRQCRSHLRRHRRCRRSPRPTGKSLRAGHRLHPVAPHLRRVERLVALKRDDHAAFEAFGFAPSSKRPVVASRHSMIRLPTKAVTLASETRRKPTFCLSLPKRPNCFTRPARSASRTSKSRGIARPGQSAPRASAAGWRGFTSSHGRCAELRSAAIGVERYRSQSPFRCTGTRCPCPRRRARRSSLSRSW